MKMNSQQPLKVLVSEENLPRVMNNITRRKLLSLGAVAGGAALLSACSGGTDSKGSVESLATGGELEPSLTVFSWGDYDNPELLKLFTEEVGPKLQLDSYGSNEELISKLVAAKGTGGYDVILPTGDYVPQMIHNGLLQKLNKDLIPNLEHMDEQFLGLDWDPEGEYTICKAWGTTGFVYDTTKIKRELKDWNDFIDCAMNEASGSTSMLDDPAESLGLYFWSKDMDWTTEDPAELDAAEEFLVNEFAQHIAAFDSYPGSGAMPQATHALIQVWNGDARQGMLESGDPDRWKWVLGAPQTELWMDNWAISSTAKNVEAAHAFINFMLEPENQVANTDYIGYHTGAKGIEETARNEGFERLDMIFFTPEQVATMKEGKITDSQSRRVDIHNKMKAAASA